MQSKEFYPSVFGIEEEKGMQTNLTGPYDEPYDLAKYLHRYIPDKFIYVSTFLDNGARLYAQGSKDVDDPTNIETATPECSSIGQVVAHSRALELFSENLASEYAQKSHQEFDRAVTVRMQRRVIDAEGNTKGCHDSFGYNTPFSLSDKTILRGHLATRSFVTGAGFTNRQGAHFAQKVTSLDFVEQFGFLSSMFRTDQNYGGERVEVRCSDPNMSDWATRVRIGSTALAVALGRANLLEPFDGYGGAGTLGYTKSMNRAHIDIEGNIKPTDYLLDAADYQQRIAELSLDKLQLNTDLPMEYFKVANELYKYCEDFKAYTKGEVDLSVLADRADWAARFAVIRRYFERQGQFDLDRSMSSIGSQIHDMEFDNVTIIGGEDKPNVSYGKGYKLRMRGNFRDTVSDDEIARAYYKPPEETRAHVRGNLLKEGWIVRTCDWDQFDIEHEGDYIQLQIKNPLQNDLTDQQRIEMINLVNG